MELSRLELFTIREIRLSTLVSIFPDKNPDTDFLVTVIAFNSPIKCSDIHISFYCLEQTDQKYDFLKLWTIKNITDEDISVLKLSGYFVIKLDLTDEQLSIFSLDVDYSRSLIDIPWVLGSSIIEKLFDG